MSSLRLEHVTHCQNHGDYSSLQAMDFNGIDLWSDVLASVGFPDAWYCVWGACQGCCMTLSCIFHAFSYISMHSNALSRILMHFHAFPRMFMHVHAFPRMFTHSPRIFMHLFTFHPLVVLITPGTTLGCHFLFDSK